MRGIVLTTAGRAAEAKAILTEALQAQEQQLGPLSADTLHTRYSLSTIMIDMNQAAEAIPLLELNLEAMTDRLGVDHANVLSVTGRLARAYQVVGNREKSLELHKRVYERRAEKMGPDHPHTVSSLQNLATAYSDQGDWEMAIELSQQALAQGITVLGKDHPDVLGLQNNLARYLMATERIEEAIPLFERVKIGAMQHLGPQHPNTMLALSGLGTALVKAGKLAAAKPHFLDALKILEAQGFKHYAASGIVADAVNLLHQTGEEDQAVQWLRKWLEFVETKHGQRSQVAANQRFQLGRLLMLQGKWTLAREALQSSVEVLMEVAPESWSGVEARAHLGKCLWELDERQAAREQLNAASATAERLGQQGTENRAVMELLNRWLGEATEMNPTKRDPEVQSPG
jgi:tetratricopeptide (TPR) repeat protein